MKMRIAGIAVVACSVSVAAFAQTNSRNPKDTMTLVGCLVGESDYRRAHGLGKGALGGVGLGDEFVLVDATTAPAAGAAERASSEPSSTAAAATPPAGATRCSETGSGKAYRLTGKREDELKPFVGRRIEVTGSFDHERDAKTDAGQTNAKLPAEIAIASFRAAPAAGAVASAGATPATPRASAEPSSTVARNEPPERGALPKTASNLPLVGLIGIMCLSAAFGLRLSRRSA